MTVFFVISNGSRRLEWRNIIQTYGKPEISRLHFVPLEMTI